MNKKKTLIFALALTLLAGAGATYAYQGDYTQKGPNSTPERHEAMMAAFENTDYEAWSNLMNGKGRVRDVITEENFAQFTEAHNLAQEGKYEEADVIREELGLRTRNGNKMGAHYRGGNKNGLNKDRRGENFKGGFIDENKDGICDHIDTTQDQQ
jgi:hypothetical protein